jgi:ubiquinone/menaquinone biosynthesis C-methylase UbiE
VRHTDYDAVASGYDVRYRTYNYTPIQNALSGFLGEGPLAAILDVGCGTGYWLHSLAGRARAVIGVDRSAGMLERATGAGVPIVRANAEQLPFIAGTFDRLVCVNALHHFADRDRFFDEARRLLTPGGGLFNVGLDPHAERDTWWVYDYFTETRSIDLERYPPVRAIRGAMARAGFAWAESCEVQIFEQVIPAREALDGGLVSREFTSQLAVLSDQEFDAGLSRVKRAMAEAERTGDELSLASELHFFATTGWV